MRTEPLLVVFAVLIVGCTRPSFPVLPPAQKMPRDFFSRAEAQDRFVRALDLDRRGRTQAADRFFLAAHELDPSSTVLRNLIIERYVDRGAFREALVILRDGKKNRELPADDKRILSQIYLKMGNFPAAATVLESIPEKTDKEIYSLALIYESLGSVSEAVNLYRQYLRSNPQALEAGLRAGLLLVRNRRIGSAETLFVDLSQRFPNNALILNAQGLCALARNDTAPALAFFEAVLQADSTNEEALRNCAQIHLQRGAYVKAVPVYERLVNMSPAESPYAKTLVLLYYYAEAYDKSRELGLRLLGSNLADPDLHFYVALTAIAQEDMDLATLELEKTLALEPQHVDAWRNLCFIYAKKKMPDKALEVALRFTNQLPDRGVSWRTLGSVHSQRKEYEKAELCLERAVALDSTDRAAWFELGSVHERRKRIDEAARAFAKVLALNPNDAPAANYLGYMWAERGEHLDSARKLLRSALRSDPDNGAYLDSYAWILFKQGNLDSALVYMEKAVSKVHDDAVIYEHLGDIRAGRKEYREALAAFRKAETLGPEDPAGVKRRIEETLKALETQPHAP